MATPPIENDNLSKALIGKIPKQFKDNDEFLDIVSWNLRWFNEQDSKRVKRITEILGALNSDIFIFQEVRKDSLDKVAEDLAEAKAGYYKVSYGTTGGDQRVAILYDTDWIKSKDDIKELFGKGNVRTGEGKDAFPRLPLWGYFACKSVHPDKRGFDFQIVGLHLKSQLGGGESQRRLACEKLAFWLERESILTDADSILMGDWNKEPDADEWSVMKKLEKDGIVRFKKINDSSDFSHLYYKNKSHIGSKLDIAVVSRDASKKLYSNVKTIRWLTIDELLAKNPKASEIKKFLKEIKEKISDHMPIFTRYYMVED